MFIRILKLDDDCLLVGMTRKNGSQVWVSKDLLEKIDHLAEKMGYRSREEFVESAIRRLIDRYLILTVNKGKN